MPRAIGGRGRQLRAGAVAVIPITTTRGHNTRRRAGPRPIVQARPERPLGHRSSPQWRPRRAVADKESAPMPFILKGTKTRGRVIAAAAALTGLIAAPAQAASIANPYDCTPQATLTQS